jgi:hypothetical protein
MKQSEGHGTPRSWAEGQAAEGEIALPLLSLADWLRRQSEILLKRGLCPPQGRREGVRPLTAKEAW